ncbi:MAG: MFS transporter [Thermoanaerobaculaceae bacterium]|nr:MFS transporter [Thermoanaerobaculaceae bacterium]
MKKTFNFASPFRFVILLGIVSLFSDITYEGARSINGIFLGSLGASAVLIGVVSGLGELCGYGLRILSGLLSDKTQKYWLFTIVGYFVNLLAVPLLALAGNYKIAAFLIILERIGKAVRTPSRDVMLSYAGSSLGSGWAFGIHEAMDQIGATIGPLFIALALSFRGDLRMGYGFLAIPAILAILALIFSRFSYPEPKDMLKKEEIIEIKGLNKNFYLYIVSICFIAAGYVDFPLIAYHLQKENIVASNIIPLFYSLAMISDALSAIVFGKLFDKFGISVILFGIFLSILFSPLVFLLGWEFALVGMALWGIGMGIQESILRAQISKLVKAEKRGSAFGIFNAFYGFSWFLGSAAMGFLYTRSIIFLILFSISAQLVAFVLIFFIRSQIEQNRQK